MIEIIISSIVAMTCLVLVYQYSSEKMNENKKLQFNIKYDIKQ